MLAAITAVKTRSRTVLDIARQVAVRLDAKAVSMDDKAQKEIAKDAAGYIRESIVDPNAYIVPGPNYRTPDGQSVMPKDFAQTLPAKDLNDVVAFLLTRK